MPHLIFTGSPPLALSPSCDCSAGFSDSNGFGQPTFDTDSNRPTQSPLSSSSSSDSETDNHSTTTTAAATVVTGDIEECVFTREEYDQLLIDYNKYLRRMDLISTIPPELRSEYPRIATGGDMFINGQLLINQKHFIPLLRRCISYFIDFNSTQLTGHSVPTPPSSTMFEHVHGGTYQLRSAPGCDHTHPNRLERAFVFLTLEIAAVTRLFYRGSSISFTKQGYREFDHVLYYPN